MHCFYDYCSHTGRQTHYEQMTTESPMLAKSLFEKINTRSTQLQSGNCQQTHMKKRYTKNPSDRRNPQFHSMPCPAAAYTKGNDCCASVQQKRCKAERELNSHHWFVRSRHSVHAPDINKCTDYTKESIIYLQGQ